jgi:hypothetical protein
MTDARTPSLRKDAAHSAATREIPLAQRTPAVRMGDYGKQVSWLAA